MSHPEQLQFVASVKAAHPEFFEGTSVLEVGSLDINGSVRQFFDTPRYVGIDLAEGPGVDVVCGGHEVPPDMGPFDVVISCEAMEHNRYWKETWERMVEVCRPGGLVIMTCATVGRPEHGTTRTTPSDAPFTNDYYKNLTELDFRQVYDFAAAFSEHAFSVHIRHRDLQFVGIKRLSDVPGKPQAEN